VAERRKRGARGRRDVSRGAGDGESRLDDHAVYVISVAAELAGVHPQTLRIYERKGLLSPRRTAGKARRYSDRDIEHLRMIQELTQEAGVNLAGVKLIMELQRELEELHRRAETLERELRARGRLRPSVTEGSEIVPLDTWLPFPWERDPSS
jgi:MerR family transcriptional regulator/heat shock protein HspR